MGESQIFVAFSENLKFKNTSEKNCQIQLYKDFEPNVERLHDSCNNLNKATAVLHLWLLIPLRPNTAILPSNHFFATCKNEKRAILIAAEIHLKISLTHDYKI